MTLDQTPPHCRPLTEEEWAWVDQVWRHAQQVKADMGLFRDCPFNDEERDAIRRSAQVTQDLIEAFVAPHRDVMNSGHPSQ